VNKFAPKANKEEILTGLSVQQSSDQELVDAIKNQYKKDILLFASICTTFDPHDKKNPYKKFPAYELPYVKKFAHAFLNEPRTVIVKSRQIMASWTFCIFGLWDILFHGARWGAFVSKKGGDSRKLIERMKFIYEQLPDWKPEVSFVLFPEPKVTCLETKSVVYSFPQGSDQLRSMTFSWVYTDEFSFQDQQEKSWRAIKPSIDGGGRFIACSTPNGSGNLFYHFCKDPEFHKIEVHYSENKYKDDKWEKEARKGVRQKDWEQEQELNFLATNENTIFGDFNYQFHVKNQKYNSDKPLLVGHDFGYNRPGVVWCQYYDGVFRILKSHLGFKTTLDAFYKEVFKLENDYFDSPNMVFDYCDSAGKQPNKQTGQTDIQALNKLLEKKNRFLRFKTCVNLEDDFNLVRDFMTKIQKGEMCFQIDPCNFNIVEGFRGGMHYHGDVQRICGCTEANEFFEKEKEYYKHLNDCIRYIIVNNFSSTGPIKATQTSLEIKTTKDRRFVNNNAMPTHF